MGFAVPAAMGAKVGRPDATVWAIDGDGCFQMTNQELATCAIEGIPIKRRSHQQRQPRHGAAMADPVLQRAPIPTPIWTAGVSPTSKLAEAYGCVGLRCDTAADVDATIDKAMAVDAGGGRPGCKRRDGLAHGSRRHQQRRHPDRARHGAGLRPE